MSTKKENIALNVGSKMSSKEVSRMVFKRIGASRVDVDLEATAEMLVTKISGTRTYLTSRQSEN